MPHTFLSVSHYKSTQYHNTFCFTLPPLFAMSPLRCTFTLCHAFSILCHALCSLCHTSCFPCHIRLHIWPHSRNGMLCTVSHSLRDVTFFAHTIPDCLLCHTRHKAVLYSIHAMSHSSFTVPYFLCDVRNALFVIPYLFKAPLSLSHTPPFLCRTVTSLWHTPRCPELLPHFYAPSSLSHVFLSSCTILLCYINFSLYHTPYLMCHTQILYHTSSLLYHAFTNSTSRVSRQCYYF